MSKADLNTLSRRLRLETSLELTSALGRGGAGAGSAEKTGRETAPAHPHAPDRKDP